MDNQQLIGDNDMFGASSQGKRLDYSKPVYNDLWCAILFVLHVIAIAVVAGIYGSKVISQIESQSSTSPTTHAPVAFQIDNLTGVAVTILASFFLATLFGFFWLLIIKKFAGAIIKFMLFLQLALCLAVAGAGAYFGFINTSQVDNASGIYLVVIGLILFLFFGLYTWCIWGRIPFASALLKIASTITSKYQGTICISLSVVVMSLVWTVAWCFACAGYIITSPTSSTYDYTTNTSSTTPQISGGVVFLFLISFYWGGQVWKNVSHTTTCGVAATWYFNENARYPTGPAFKRTMTTSFGSVCLGSFIVAVLQAIRAMLRSMRGNAILKCIALCLLACIESLIRYFNVYAYAQCAIYGKSFIEAAKATFELLSTELWKAIINDDLTGYPLVAGAFMGFVFCGACGFGIGKAFYPAEDYVPFVAVLAIISACIGIVIVVQVLYVVRSSVVCIFVCYSEDPKALEANHPREFSDVTGIKPQLMRVYEGHTTVTEA